MPNDKSSWQIAENLSFRTVRPQDRGFLLALFSSARKKELDSLDWDAGKRRIFLEMQFQAQQRHYQEHFPTRNHRIVLLDKRPIGMTDIARGKNEIRLLDIILKPENRNAGIGTTLMQAVVDEAEKTGRAVRLYVEKFNPAFRFYRRLGFTVIDDTGVHYHMERLPADVEKPPGNRKATGG